MRLADLVLAEEKNGAAAAAPKTRRVHEPTLDQHNYKCMHERGAPTCPRPSASKIKRTAADEPPLCACSLVCWTRVYGSRTRSLAHAHVESVSRPEKVKNISIHTTHWLSRHASHTGTPGPSTTCT